jgi:hypothetical protein
MEQALLGGTRSGKQRQSALFAAAVLIVGGSVVVAGDKGKDVLLFRLSKLDIHPKPEPLNNGDWILKL